MKLANPTLERVREMAKQGWEPTGQVNPDGSLTLKKSETKAPAPVAETPPIVQPKQEPKTIAAMTSEVEDTRRKNIADIKGGLPEKPGFMQRRKEDVAAIGKSAKRWGLESAGRELEKYGDSGKQLLHLAKKTDADAAGFAGELTAKLDQAVEGFSKADIETLIDVIEGKAKTVDPRIAKAHKVYLENDALLTRLAKDTDLHVKSGKGEFEPFEAAQNYYPHKYDDRYFDSPDVQAKMVADLMDKEKVSRKVAESIIAKAREKNPRVIDPLHRRQFSFEGYRKDLDVIRGHYQDMAQRAFESKNFGWRDLGGDNLTPVNELLEKIKGERGLTDWENASQIMSKYLGRDEFRQSRTANVITKFQAATKLALSAPSNVAGGISMTAFRAGPIDAASAALRAFTKEGKLEAKRLGTLQSLFKDAANDAGYGGWFSKAYGINAAEQYLRTVSALAGKSEAQQMFAKLKKNPMNQNLKRQLGDLVLDNVDEVMKQDSLTNEQIKRAANRFTDLTQGRSNVMDLPLNWSNNPTANVLTQFKKFAFIQSKNMKDFLLSQTKMGKTKAVASILITMPIAGELAGDIREFVKGMVPGGEDPIEAVLNRGDGKLIDRLLDNYSQAFALGLLSEGMETLNAQAYMGGQPTRDTKGRAASFLLGPTVSDTLSAVGAIADIPGRKTDKLAPVKRELVGKIPAIGQELKSRMVQKKKPGYKFGEY